MYSILVTYVCGKKKKKKNVDKIIRTKNMEKIKCGGTKCVRVK